MKFSDLWADEPPQDQLTVIAPGETAHGVTNETGSAIVLEIDENGAKRARFVSEQLTLDEEAESFGDWIIRVSQHQPQKSEED